MMICATALRQLDPLACRFAALGICMHLSVTVAGERMVCESDGYCLRERRRGAAASTVNEGVDFHYTIVDFGPGDRVDRVAGVWLNERAGSSTRTSWSG